MVLHGFAQFCVVLRGLTWFLMDSLCFVWFCVVSCGFAQFCMVLRGFTWFRLVLRGFAWFCVVSHGFAWIHYVSRGFMWFRKSQIQKVPMSSLENNNKYAGLHQCVQACTVVSECTQACAELQGYARVGTGVCRHGTGMHRCALVCAGVPGCVLKKCF